METKVCNCCGQSKEISQYYIRKTYIQNHCKVCERLKHKIRVQKSGKSKLYNDKYRLNNKEKLKKRKADYYQKNKKAIQLKKKEYNKNNQEKIKQQRHEEYKRHIDSYKKRAKLRYFQKKAEVQKYFAKYYEENKYGFIQRAKDRNDLLNKPLALKYIDEIKAIYKKAHDERKHVDHIIPLNNKKVCGLHVPWNLQLLDPKYNRLKSNKFDGTNENQTWRECV